MSKVTPDTGTSQTPITDNKKTKQVHPAPTEEEYENESVYDDDAQSVISDDSEEDLGEQEESIEPGKTNVGVAEIKVLKKGNENNVPTSPQRASRPLANKSSVDTNQDTSLSPGQKQIPLHILAKASAGSSPNLRLKHPENPLEGSAVGAGDEQQPSSYRESIAPKNPSSTSPIAIKSRSSSQSSEGTNYPREGSPSQIFEVDMSRSSTFARKDDKRYRSSSRDSAEDKDQKTVEQQRSESPQYHETPIPGNTSTPPQSPVQNPSESLAENKSGGRQATRNQNTKRISLDSSTHSYSSSDSESDKDSVFNVIGRSRSGSSTEGDKSSKKSNEGGVNSQSGNTDQGFVQTQIRSRRGFGFFGRTTNTVEPVKNLAEDNNNETLETPKRQKSVNSETPTSNNSQIGIGSSKIAPLNPTIQRKSNESNSSGTSTNKSQKDKGLLENLVSGLFQSPSRAKVQNDDSESKVEDPPQTPAGQYKDMGGKGSEQVAPFPQVGRETTNKAKSPTAQNVSAENDLVLIKHKAINPESIWKTNPNLASRANNYKVSTNDYPLDPTKKENTVLNGKDKDVFLAICSKILEKYHIGKEEFVEITKLSKKMGSLSHVINPTTGNYIKDQKTTLENFKENSEFFNEKCEEGRGAQNRMNKWKTISKFFQDECKAHGIFSGREDGKPGKDGKPEGLRLTFLQDEIVEELKNSKEPLEFNEARINLLDDVKSNKGKERS